METKNIYSPQPNSPMSIGVLLSGSGTNFEALFRRQAELSQEGSDDARIEIVFSNVPDCRGVRIARELGINTAALSSKYFFERLGRPPDDEESRDLYDREVIGMIEETALPDLIVLAGYRRRPGPLFYSRYADKIINMYPGDTNKSYLEKGLPASLQALRHNDNEICCTVYLDREGQRFGPALAQSKPISLSNHNEENILLLDKEIREKAEWETLPFVVFDLIAKGRVSIDSKENVYLDGVKLNSSGYRL